MSVQTIPKHVLDVSKHVLYEYYPEHRVEAPLPPDLLELCIGFLIEEKKEYWSNGHLKSHGIYVNGEKHWEWKEWCQNGQLWSQTIYMNKDIV